MPQEISSFSEVVAVHLMVKQHKSPLYHVIMSFYEYQRATRKCVLCTQGTQVTSGLTIIGYRCSHFNEDPWQRTRIVSVHIHAHTSWRKSSQKKWRMWLDYQTKTHLCGSSCGSLETRNRWLEALADDIPRRCVRTTVKQPILVYNHNGFDECVC